MSIFSYKIPPRWKSGCWALWLAGVLCAYILKHVASGIGWLVQQIDGLPPLASAIAGQVAVIVLTPLVISVLIYLWRDWKAFWTRAFSFWWLGFRISVIALLLILPFLILRQMSELLKASMGEPGTLMRWLVLSLAGIVFILLPFWAWAVLRRLPQTFLGRGLFDDSDLDRIEQDPKL